MRPRIRILELLADGPRTGPELANTLDCTRTAVWKHVEALREADFDIESGPDGYTLESVPEYGAPAIEFGLEAPYRVEYHESVPSTNDVARDLAAAGETDVVVIADEQTGGRGRRDRAWESPPGGIWLSLLLRPDIPPAKVPSLTLAAGVAIVDAFDPLDIDAEIKWPNDVLVETGSGETAKLAGVLTEMAGESAQVSWVVIGIGLNANVHVDALAAGATSLRELVGDVNRRDIVQRLLDRLHVLASDPAAIREAWIDRAATLGREVRVDTPGGSVTGRAVDVTDVGALVMETEVGTRTVTAGDCEHLRPV